MEMPEADAVREIPEPAQRQPGEGLVILEQGNRAEAGQEERSLDGSGDRAAEIETMAAAEAEQEPDRISGPQRAVGGGRGALGLEPRQRLLGLGGGQRIGFGRRFAAGALLGEEGGAALLDLVVGIFGTSHGLERARLLAGDEARAPRRDRAAGHAFSPETLSRHPPAPERKRSG
jgi:hypothetical protein